MHIGTTLTELEAERLQKFRARHEKKHGPCRAAAGGRYYYTIAPCGLGAAVHIHCHACRKKLDITEYDSW